MVNFIARGSLRRSMMGIIQAVPDAFVTDLSFELCWYQTSLLGKSTTVDFGLFAAAPAFCAQIKSSIFPFGTLASRRKLTRASHENQLWRGRVSCIAFVVVLGQGP